MKLELLDCAKCIQGYYRQNGTTDFRGFTPVKCDSCGDEQEQASLEDWFKYRVNHTPDVSDQEVIKLKDRVSEIVKKANQP